LRLIALLLIVIYLSEILTLRCEKTAFAGRFDRDTLKPQSPFIIVKYESTNQEYFCTCFGIKIVGASEAHQTRNQGKL
jgi:hypothetical protein